MPRASVVVRPGWNEAAHTDAELLHGSRLLRVQDARGGPAPAGLGGRGPPACGLLCAKLIISPHIQLGWGCRDSPFQTVTLHGREL